jgi:hypothetical protein
MLFASVSSTSLAAAAVASCKAFCNGGGIMQLLRKEGRDGLLHYRQMRKKVSIFFFLLLSGPGGQGHICILSCFMPVCSIIGPDTHKAARTIIIHAWPLAGSRGPGIERSFARAKLSGKKNVDRIAPITLFCTYHIVNSNK